MKHTVIFHLFVSLFALGIASLGHTSENAPLPTATYTDSYARFIHFTEQEGLSNNLVLDILQDKSGCMWFATKNGLTRFDGNHYTTYRNEPNKPFSLSDNLVTSLAEDSDGNLWIGTHDGLNKYDRPNDRFIRYKAQEGLLNGPQNNLIKALYADKDHNIWLETEGGYLSRLDLRTQTWEHLHHNLHNPIEGEYYYHHIYEDSRQTLWIGGRLSSIVRIPMRDIRLAQHPIPNSDELYFDPGCFVETGDGTILCSDYHGNLGRYNHQTKTFNTIFRLPLSPTSAVKDDNGTIWLGGAGGIIRLNLNGRRLEYVQNDPLNNHSLLSDNIFCLYKDKEGNIWIGTDKGVALYPTQLNKIRLYRHIASRGGLSENHVTALMQDRDGVIWVGTENNGIDTFSLKNEKFGNLTYKLLTQNLSANTFEREKGTLRQYFQHEFITSSHPTDIDNILASYNNFRSAPLTFKRINENNISALYEDKEGMIYIGLWSHVGFNVYDKKRQEFKRYALWSKKPDFLYPNFLRGNPFGSNWYNGFLEDHTSKFWCVTWEGVGLNLFDREKGQFSGKHYMRQSYPSGTGAYIQAISFDPERNRLYLAGGRYIGYYDQTSRRFIQFVEILPKGYTNRALMNAYLPYQDAEPMPLPLYGINMNCYYDHQDHLWIAGHDFTSSFLLCHTPSSKETKQVFTIPRTSGFIIAPSFDGRHIFLGSDSTLYQLTIADQTVIPLPISNVHPYPISSLFADQDENLWIGTENGLYLYHPTTKQANRVLSECSKITAISGLPSKDIFIGCDSGLIWLQDLREKAFLPFNTSSSKGLPGMSIQHINTRQPGYLWISTNNGLVKLELAKLKRTLFFHDNLNPQSLPHNHVTCTFWDPALEELWVTTANGASTLNIKDEVFTNKSVPNETSLSSRLASCILEDSFGYIWVGTTESGLNRLNPQTDQMSHFTHQPWDTTSLPHNHIHCLTEDHTQQIWIGTEKGLCKYVPSENRLKRINALTDRAIHGIQEDRNHFLWITTDQGLYCLDKKGDIFRSFGEEHGFQGNAYTKAACLLQDGLLAIGGYYGFNVFDPAELTLPVPSPAILFSHLKTGDSIRYKHINNRDKITLNHSENSFSFEFSATDYIYGSHLQYRYRLDGFDKDWTYTKPPYLNTKYTNIPPGYYDFQIEVSNRYGEWNGTIHSLSIHITPPWYQRIWFICISILFLIACILCYIRFRERKLRKRQADLERLVAERTRSLTEAIESKNKFFSILSHDLKNPIHSIHSTIHILYKEYKTLNETERLEIIQVLDRTSQNTNNLLENILLWVLSQREILQPYKQRIELRSFTSSLLELFQPDIKGKNIQLTNNIPSDTYVFSDQNMLATILRNLLSNALKFSFPDGEITLLTSPSDDPGKIEVLVIDQGTGMSKENLSHLFQPGFKSQTKGTKQEKGNGLGLIIVYEFIIKLEERIFVSSEPGKGSTFRFTLSKYITHENN